MPRVQRPTLLGLVCAIAFGSALAAGSGLWGLREARLAGPVSLVAATEGVADALGDAPWIGSESNGPIVWAFTRPDCDCGRLTPAAVAGLAEEEMEIRMVVVSPRPGDARAAPAASDADVAALAEARDWRMLKAWAGGQKLTGAPADRAAAEGDIEWGRASYDRLAAILRENGVSPKLPLLIWRRGPEWRVLVGSHAATLDTVRHDMAVES